MRRLFRRHGSLPRARHVLLLDTTMVGPSHDLCSCLAAAADDCEVAIAFSSGPKLDQAGLELANVGIARVLVRHGARQRAAGLLRRGSSAARWQPADIDELWAISAPWSLDRAYVDDYTAAIFADNQLLAQSIADRLSSAAPPSLAVGVPPLPFCDPSVARRIARALRVWPRSSSNRASGAGCC